MFANEFSVWRPKRSSVIRLFLTLLSILTFAVGPSHAQVVTLGDISQVPANPSILAANGLAVDSKGNIYTSDYNTNKVNAISPQGKVTQVNTGSYSLNNPNGLALDSAGDLYIADSGNNRILEVTATGQTNPVPLGSITLNNPMGIAVDAFGELFISDTGSGKVYRISSIHGNENIAFSAVSAAGSQALAVSPDGNTLYVANPTPGNS